MRHSHGRVKKIIRQRIVGTPGHVPSVEAIVRLAASAFVPAPKPERSLPAKRQFSSIKPESHSSKLLRARKMEAKRKPIKKKSRSKSEFARIYGSKQRVAWVKLQPCIVATSQCIGGIEGHHIKTLGTGIKAGYRFVVPLCFGHHRRLHVMGRETFEDRYDIDLELSADRTHSRWEDFCETAGLKP